MEELLTLKELLLQGKIPDAIAIVEEMEEMSKDDKISNIISYGVVLLIHLIKQQVENRTTRSWDISIRNSVLAIQEKNKRRKAGGFYLTPEELRMALEAAYKQAINRAVLEVEEGRYTRDELIELVNREEIIERAMYLVSLVDEM
jgi:hypothetical protein